MIRVANLTRTDAAYGLRRQAWHPGRRHAGSPRKDMKGLVQILLLQITISLAKP